MEGFNFGEALDAVKHGNKIARKGWNGKGMYLEYVDPYDTKLFELHEKEIIGTLMPWLGMQTAQNTFVPWLASQTDILAEDWEII